VRALRWCRLAPHWRRQPRHPIWQAALLLALVLGAGAGEARRVNPPKDSPEGKAFKSEYDRRRRAVLGDVLREKKRAAYHAAVERDEAAVREKQRAQRAARVDDHNAYCRRPEYVAKKRDYDVVYRARQDFGDFAEAALVLRDIEREVDERATRDERAAAKGTVNKKQTRRRRHDQEARA
jgi:hypothetical protein